MEDNNEKGISIHITTPKLRRTFEKIAIASFIFDYLLGIANTFIISKSSVGFCLSQSLCWSPSSMLYYAQLGITATDYIGIPVIVLLVYLFATEKVYPYFIPKK